MAGITHLDNYLYCTVQYKTQDNLQLIIVVDCEEVWTLYLYQDLLPSVHKTTTITSPTKHKLYQEDEQINQQSDQGQQDMAEQHSALMSEAHIATLRACRFDLEKGLNVEHIMARCRQHGVITKALQDQILAQPTSIKKCREFLDILETRTVDAFDVFVTALKEENYEHFASQLEAKLPVQSLNIAKTNLQIATMNTQTLKKLKQHEQAVTKSSIAEVEALLVQLKLDLGLKESLQPHVKSVITSSDLSKCNITLKQKIKLPDFCRGMCFTPKGEVVVAIQNQGIIVYNKDFTIKLKFTVDKPDDVICLPTGVFIVSSYGNNYVKQYDSNGQYEQDICQQVNKPRGLAYNNVLGLVVTGRDPHCVYICTTAGEVTQTISNDEFKWLSKVHINPYTLHILVSDSHYTTITLHCLTKDGTHVFKYKGHGEGMPSSPRGIFVTEQHILLIDTDNHRVLLLSHKGEYIKVLMTKQQHGLHSPAEVLVDSTGNILVGEGYLGKNQLYVFKVNTK